MGRMFRIISEGPIEAVTAGAALAHAPEEPFVSGNAPYIEVGGASPVFHAPKPTRSTPIEQTPPPACSHEYLKVALQALATKPAASQPLIAKEIVAYHQPNHAVSGEYRELAASIQRQNGAEGEPKAILLTSAGRDRGTTTVLLNLAVTLAAEARVLVIDADFDHSSASRMLGLAEVPGLSEVLTQSSPLAWALQPTPLPKLQVLASGSALTEAPIEELPRVLTQLRQWYDWILIDGGVWGERPSRDTISAAFDSIYLVTRQGETHAAAFKPQIARHGGLLRGFITTQL